MQNKISQSAVIASIVLILIVLSSIIILYNLTKTINKSPQSCFYFNLGSIKTCYLNDNQLKLTLNYNIQFPNINKIKISFSPSGSLWEITGKKCSDIKLENNSYGNYCQIPLPGESKTYILNLTNLSKQDKIFLDVYINDSLCNLAQSQIIDC